MPGKNPGYDSQSSEDLIRILSRQFLPRFFVHPRLQAYGPKYGCFHSGTYLGGRVTDGRISFWTGTISP